MCKSSDIAIMAAYGRISCVTKTNNPAVLSRDLLFYFFWGDDDIDAMRALAIMTVQRRLFVTIIPHV